VSAGATAPVLSGAVAHMAFGGLDEVTRGVEEMTTP